MIFCGVINRYKLSPQIHTMFLYLYNTEIYMLAPVLWCFLSIHQMFKMATIAWMWWWQWYKADWHPCWASCWGNCYTEKSRASGPLVYVKFPTSKESCGVEVRWYGWSLHTSSVSLHLTESQCLVILLHCCGSMVLHHLADRTHLSKGAPSNELNKVVRWWWWWK